VRGLEVGLVVAALVCVLPLVAIHVRRRVLQRSGGTIELSLQRRRLAHGRGWALGIGRFQGDELRWYRVFSLAPRPRATLCRRDLKVLRRRQPAGGETLALLDGAVVLHCENARGPVDLAMDPSAVTGFLAWLEAAPPGGLPPGP